MADEKSVPMSVTAASQLREVLATIDDGVLTASARERAYIAGAAHALEALASEAVERPEPT